MPKEIQSGEQTTKHPLAEEVFTLDWDRFQPLAPGVQITTSTWTITGPDAALTKDNPSIDAGGRKTRVRLLAGTLGATYVITNDIVTNESPTQRPYREFSLYITKRPA